MSNLIPKSNPIFFAISLVIFLFTSQQKKNFFFSKIFNYLLFSFLWTCLAKSNHFAKRNFVFQHFPLLLFSFMHFFIKYSRFTSHSFKLKWKKSADLYIVYLSFYCLLTRKVLTRWKFLANCYGSREKLWWIVKKFSFYLRGELCIDVLSCVCVSEKGDFPW